MKTQTDSLSWPLPPFEKSFALVHNHRQMLMGKTNESSLYPLTKTKICSFCKEKITLHRQGDGAPRLGLLNYWYETDHAYPQRRQFTSRIVFEPKKRASA